MRKLLLALGLLLSLTVGTARAQFCPGAAPYVFTDVLITDPFCVFITRMAVEGITEGCEIIDANNRRFCPDDFVTRKQMSAFIMRAVDLVQPMFAVLNANGTLARGRSVTSVLKLGGLGNYEVVFNRDVTTCVYTATLGPSGGGSTFGEVNVASRAGNANGVFVDTNNSDGISADKPFHLLVNC
jgi:hypothetical protein